MYKRRVKLREQKVFSIVAFYYTEVEKKQIEELFSTR